MNDAPFAEKLIAADSEDPAARVARTRLATALEELNPAGGILDTGDGTGRHANKEKKKPSEKPETKTINPLTAEEQDRAARFDKLDKEQAGKLTRDVYASRQSDAEAAGKRFDNWDADQDGFLTREEYIHRNQEP